MKNNKFNIILIPIITAVLSLIVLGFSSLYPKTRNSKTYSNFLEDLNNQEISQVSFDSSSKILVTLKDGYTYSTDNPKSENFKENLLLNNIDVVEEPVAPLSKTIPATILIISIFAIVFLPFIQSRMEYPVHQPVPNYSTGMKKREVQNCSQTQ